MVADSTKRISDNDVVGGKLSHPRKQGGGYYTLLIALFPVAFSSFCFITLSQVIYVAVVVVRSKSDSVNVETTTTTTTATTTVQSNK
jgi:hypothetical protein